MNIEDLAEKHQNDLPGYKLVDYYDAAFPSYQVQLRALIQVSKPISVLDEFVLKAIQAGQEKIEDIAGLLGLERNIVQEALSRLEQSSQVIIANSTDEQVLRIKLTNKGKKSLSELLIIQPEQSNLAITVDALTGKISPKRPLRKTKEVKELYFPIPSYLKKTDFDDLKQEFFTLKRVFADSYGNAHDTFQERHLRRPKKELLEIIEIEKVWVEYRILRILQFIRPDDNTLQVEVFDGNERSQLHESVLLRMEEEQYRPLRAVFKKDTPPYTLDEIPQNLQKFIPAAQRKATELPRVNREIEDKTRQLGDEKKKLGSNVTSERQEASYVIERLKQEIENLKIEKQRLEKAAGSIEALQMAEHRKKLYEAFDAAKSHVIVISPWLNQDAVNYELTQKIGVCLARGVTVFIGHGFGEATTQEKFTLEKLDKISRNKKGKLITQRFGDVHSKVLICDDSYIVLTSFNWLSFRGDPKRGSRVEDGMLTTDKKVIRTKTEEWLQRFNKLETDRFLQKLYPENIVEN
jgi:hypothetical protein